MAAATSTLVATPVAPVLMDSLARTNAAFSPAGWAMQPSRPTAQAAKEAAAAARAAAAALPPRSPPRVPGGVGVGGVSVSRGMSPAARAEIAGRARQEVIVGILSPDKPRHTRLFEALLRADAAAHAREGAEGYVDANTPRDGGGKEGRRAVRTLDLGTQNDAKGGEAQPAAGAEAADRDGGPKRGAINGMAVAMALGVAALAAGVALLLGNSGGGGGRAHGSIAGRPARVGAARRISQGKVTQSGIAWDSPGMVSGSA
jgi:hypothetical protein